MSNETKHTPGPWVIAEEDNYDHDGIGVFARSAKGARFYVARCAYLGDHAEANARLIAAAPDLLAACKVAADAISEAMRRAEIAGDGESMVRLGYDLAPIRAAIARAEGGK